jgi:dTDP-L-rhamnose 4-epimerase
MKQILITGGAGLIGSHLADHLLARGYRVRALDNLLEQVHGPSGERPAYLDPRVELVVGDVRDAATLRYALRDVDAVFHFAAAVGVGQSMYEVATYTSINNLGTAVLWEAIAKRPVESLIVASSMSIYGEGLYRRADGTIVNGRERSLAQLKLHAWELRDDDGAALEPLATTEEKQPSVSSVYALSKFDQERMCLMMGRAYGVRTVALRFFNVFGPRQALANPYTGVLAIFASRYLNGKPPLVFEDGEQRRDFVSVLDVVQACRLALEVPAAGDHVFNIGCGQSYTVREIAERLAQVLGREDIVPEITGRYRVGDIRHCFADIALARRILGYRPQISLEDGLTDLAAWLEGQEPDDLVPQARAELAQRGLTL